jgi:hypothetical protein
MGTPIAAPRRSADSALTKRSAAATMLVQPIGRSLSVRVNRVVRGLSGTRERTETIPPVAGEGDRLPSRFPVYPRQGS